jgi:hypothetical protein
MSRPPQIATPHEVLIPRRVNPATGCIAVIGAPRDERAAQVTACHDVLIPQRADPAAC